MVEKRHSQRIPPELEKRRFLRVPVENVTVEVYNASGEPETPEVCPILNLSESGMLFETTNRYQSGSTLRLTFALPDSIVIVRTNAYVIHQFWKGEDGYVGVCFQKVGVPERNGIRAYVQKHQMA